VGDDWQSIYRFSGSDLALFKDYEQYFGFTVRSRIETTYRFHDPVIGLSSDFILRNPNQTKKALKSASIMKKTNYEVIYSSADNKDDTQALQNIFNELITSVRDIEKKDVLIVGRYGMDIERIRNHGDVFRIDRNNHTLSYSVRLDKVNTKTIQAQFMTVHKSKGLEGDIVIILNCNSGKLGFPSEMSDDRVLDLLLSEADQFANGEERRLFYVAMTRAREKVYFVADESYKSKFIMELENTSLSTSANRCPNCKSADVMIMKTGVAKNGKSYKFYGCMNYIYGCNYSKTEWQNT
jgi:DNA helicase-4